MKRMDAAGFGHAWRLGISLLACGFYLAAVHAHADSVSFDGRELAGAYEIYRNNSSSISVQPTRIEVNRNGQMATELTQFVHGGDNIYSLLQFSLSEGGKIFTVPNGRRLGWYSWSNAGAAVLALDDNKVYRVPWEGAAESVFNRSVTNVGGPAINDQGVIAFASRDSASHPLRDLWINQPGQSTVALPDLNEYGLRNEIVIDGLGRVIHTHEFREPNTPTSRQIMRYSATAGWENLTEHVEGAVTGIIGVQPVNSRGDFLFASGQWLNLFEAETGAAHRLVAFSGNIQEVRAKVADTGDALVTLRTPSSLDAFRYDALSGSVTDLATLVPQGHSLTRGRLPTMNHVGDIVFGSISADGYSYYLLDAGSEEVEPIAALKGFELHDYVLSDTKQLYFWLWTTDEALLAVLRIPEPSTTWLMCLAIVLFSPAIRRRDQS